MGLGLAKLHLPGVDFVVSFHLAFVEVSAVLFLLRRPSAEPFDGKSGTFTNPQPGLAGALTPRKRLLLIFGSLSAIRGGRSTDTTALQIPAAIARGVRSTDTTYSGSLSAIRRSSLFYIGKRA